MDVDEFQLTEFKRKVLRYTDDDTDDRDLRYFVTVPPFDTDANTPMAAGTLVLCEDDSQPITFFTQAQVSYRRLHEDRRCRQGHRHLSWTWQTAKKSWNPRLVFGGQGPYKTNKHRHNWCPFIFQVNHRKLCFKPPSSELGLVPRILQFFFDVQDTSGNILTNQRFTILLKPVDNKPPVITNGGINILEDGITIISTDNLDVVDPDTDSKDLVFEVSSDWFSCKGKAI